MISLNLWSSYRCAPTDSVMHVCQKHFNNCFARIRHQKICLIATAALFECNDIPESLVKLQFRANRLSNACRSITFQELFSRIRHQKICLIATITLPKLTAYSRLISLNGMISLIMNHWSSYSWVPTDSAMPARQKHFNNVVMIRHQNICSIATVSLPKRT